MFKPFTEQYIPVDLCTGKPLDYGYSTVLCDRTFFSELNPSMPFTAMLAPANLLITAPAEPYLTHEEIMEMISYSKKKLPDFSEYKLGYKAGICDALMYHARETFRKETEVTVAFCAGYELGIYLGSVFGTIFITRDSIPKLEDYLK